MAGKHRRAGAPVDELVHEAELADLSELTDAEADAEAEAETYAEPEPAPPVAYEAAAVSLLPGGAPTGRLAVRTARRQRARRTRLATVVVAGGLVLAVVAALFVLLRGGGDDEASALPSGRTQSTVLLQVLDPQRQTLAAVLLGHNSAGAGSGAAVLVPSQLVVTVPGTGAMTFGQTVTGGTNAAASGLSTSLGVLVDGSWQLDSAGLAALVDSVGGVDVTVDRDVTQTTPAGTVTVLSQGPQHLGGASAALYSTYLAPQEAEQARLARFSAVLTELLGKLPADEAGVARTLAALGQHSTGNVSPSRLAAFVTGLRADRVANNLALDTLPVRMLDPGFGPPQMLLDHAAAETLVARDFAGSRPPTSAAGPVRVLVQNGVGTPGLGTKAQARLVTAGLTFVDGGNAAHFGVPTSTVLILDATEKSRAQGAQVAKALGLPVSDIQVTPQGQTLADVVVVLGKDFKP